MLTAIARNSRSGVQAAIQAAGRGDGSGDLEGIASPLPLLMFTRATHSHPLIVGGSYSTVLSLEVCVGNKTTEF